MEPITLHLPYPPSANTYWRHPTKGRLAGRHLISEAGRSYRTNVMATVLEQRGAVKPLQDRLFVKIVAYMPDRRRRDLDNILKALFDALTHAGVWSDDSQIDAISLYRAKEIQGRLEVTICAIDDDVDEA